MHSTSRSTATRTLVCVLALALWIAATLGLVHRTLHAHATGLPELAEKVDASAPSSSHSSPHGLFALFGDHTDAECRLYDQLSHGSAALSVPLVILPVTLPAATFAWLEGEALARWATLFDARGPPSTR
ncbi:hypothetical protein [Variovorax sp. Sphag1AA]|uniref:hypothetical protein n=1 Tax=Variovorax sp. Sphag1AA TaxID=2587027 RepID=UPI001618701E|nr:hypothetical protein [Variovorax sp. Sphag1AA]MBB3179027.1 hypothetical protein [Variovorax sp. Sphag1AA]